MGNVLGCAFDDALDDDAQARLTVMQRGNKFRKKKAVILSDLVHVRVSDTTDGVHWREIDTRGTPQHDKVSFDEVSSITAYGKNGIVFKTPAGDKVLELEVDEDIHPTSANSGRDFWVMGLGEVLQRYRGSGAFVKKQEEEKKEAFEQGKKSYWKERQREIKQNKAAAEARKAKYTNNTGMKYTAAARMGGGGGDDNAA